MAKKPAKSSGNPYKVLYWMGGGVVLLLLGVVALAVMMPKAAETADPERTVLWIQGAGADSVVIIEESRSAGTLVAVPFPAPEEARSAFGGGKSAYQATEALSRFLNRRIHHRVFMPAGVAATLIDAAGGIDVEGRSLNGASALAYIQEGGTQGARRAALVMLGLAEAAATRGVNMGVSEGLRLAREIDTSLDLTSIPTVLGRWSRYQSPRVESPAVFDAATIQKLLQPDPAPSGK